MSQYKVTIGSTDSELNKALSDCLNDSFLAEQVDVIMLDQDTKELRPSGDSLVQVAGPFTFFYQYDGEVDDKVRAQWRSYHKKMMEQMQSVDMLRHELVVDRDRVSARALITQRKVRTPVVDEGFLLPSCCLQ